MSRGDEMSCMSRGEEMSCMSRGDEMRCRGAELYVKASSQHTAGLNIQEALTEYEASTQYRQQACSRCQ
jgi:hypothetical protein